MSDMLGYARVSTGDQDVAGQALRLMQAGAIKVFTDVRSGRTMEWRVFLHKGTKRDTGGQRSRSFRPGSLSEPSACR